MTPLPATILPPQHEEAPGLPTLPGDLAVEHRTGRQSLLDAEDELRALAHRCGRPAFPCLRFFLDAPHFGRKLPHLLLFRSSDNGPVQAAVVLYEYVLAGLPTGILISPDAEGEQTVLAPEPWSEGIVWKAAATLLSGRSRLLLLTLRDANFAHRSECERFPTRATMRRTSRHDLLLKQDMEATLVQFGPRTRRNLRAARRRVIRSGITFHADAAVSLEEFLTLARSSSYAVSERTAEWRYQAARTYGYVAGLRDGEGRWLALLGGRRNGDMTVVDWQFNHTSLRQLSLGLAMRCFLMEEEIARGTRVLRFEGGTPHPMRSGFAENNVGYALLGSGCMRPALVRRVLRYVAGERSLLNTWLDWDRLRWHVPPGLHRDGACEHRT